jgi:hypothetical protein
MRSRTKLTTVACSAALAALCATSVTVLAQAGPPGSPPGGPEPRVLYRQLGPGPGPLGTEDVIGFVGIEAGLGPNTVTGAPFSATFSQETTQNLADGNHIQRTSTGTMARDGNGRTHRDLTLPAIGEWATSGRTPPHLVLISDPVANANYVLETDRKIARQMPALRGGKGGKVGMGPGGPPPFGLEPQNESTSLSLGTQMINGISAQGTRTTRTIPAGAIGNEKPIVITVERWYSPDLQMNVMIKRSDPRTGDNVFQLTNIVRSEPDASLFQVPSDYTVKQVSPGEKVREGGKFLMRKGGPGGPPPLPPPPGTP